MSDFSFVFSAGSSTTFNFTTATSTTNASAVAAAPARPARLPRPARPAKEEEAKEKERRGEEKRKEKKEKKKRKKREKRAKRRAAEAAAAAATTTTTKAEDEEDEEEEEKEKKEEEEEKKIKREFSPGNLGARTPETGPWFMGRSPHSGPSNLRSIPSFYVARRAYATPSDPYDVIVIGSGPGGYVCSIKASQMGLRTACIDSRGIPGGTCLNVGCIPSKSLLNNSHLYHQILHDTKKRGIDVKGVELNLEQMMKAKDESVSSLTKGVEFLFKKNKVDFIKGTASFVNEHDIAVNLLDGGETQISGKNIIIATGSESTPFPGLPLDEERVVSSTGAIALKEVPKKMVVIGGGIIGLEMGSVWQRLGSEVTVVEFLPQIGGPGMDADISKQTQKILTKQGMKFKLNTKVNSGKREGDTVKLEIEAAKGGKNETLEADVCLVAIGRRPYTAGLGLENIDLELDDKKRLVIDQEYRTKIPHIRVIGDATFGPMLAHKAEDEGIAAAEYISKGFGHVNYGAIPSVMYTHPEVAWVGQNEAELKKAGIKYNVGNFPFTANSRAKTNLETDGTVKFLSDKETDRILGVHIIGPNAGEMIAEATLAMEYGASSEDVARTCHAHPTLAEAFKEGAMATYSQAIHF